MVQASGNAANAAATGITVAPTESAIYTQIRAWLLSVLPAGCEVIQGQQNQTAAPAGLFATMTLINKARLATNDSYYTPTSRVVTEPTRMNVQCSVFGPGAGDAIHRVVALFRDMNAADYFSTSGIDLAPLYASEARQMGFITAEKQYQDMWSSDLSFQVNYVLTIPQQSAISAKASSVEADVITQP